MPDANEELQRELDVVKTRLTAIEDAAHARTDAERFVFNHQHDYLQTYKNATRMTEAVQERGLPMTLESFEKVFQEIKDTLEQPEPAAEPVSQSASVETPAEAKPKLTADDKAFLEQVERMPSNEFRKKLQDKAFTDRYNKLVPQPVVGP